MTENEFQTCIQLLRLFADFPTWTRHKHNTLKRVTDYMQSGVHEYFTSNCTTQGLSMVGEYYTEASDHQRRGTLMKYRGTKVMVLCVGHGSYMNREYLAATITNQKTQ
jgi:hypothetical protein